MNTDEGGLLEILQVIVCLISFIYFLLAAKNQFRKGFMDQFGTSLFFSVVPYLGASRELSFGEVLGVEGAGLLAVKYVLGGILILLLATSFVSMVIALKNRSLNVRNSLLGYPFWVRWLFTVTEDRCDGRGCGGFCGLSG